MAHGAHIFVSIQSSDCHSKSSRRTAPAFASGQESSVSGCRNGTHCSNATPGVYDLFSRSSVVNDAMLLRLQYRRSSHWLRCCSCMHPFWLSLISFPPPIMNRLSTVYKAVTLALVHIIGTSGGVLEGQDKRLRLPSSNGGYPD